MRTCLRQSRGLRYIAACVPAGLVLALVPCPSYAKGIAEYVIQVSVDGGGPAYIQHLIEQGDLPNFKRLQSEGASTNNARTDYDFTITLPNHTCMVTGRPVYDKRGERGSAPGHQWTLNVDPGEATLHSNAHTYVKSTFDVAHDNGLRTSLYATKSKFSLYRQSYDGAHGAPDMVGKDNGRDKIDVWVVNENPLTTTCNFIVSMSESPSNYSFVHFRNADSAGHAQGWGTPEYFAALREVDLYLGMILQLADTDMKLRGKTTIILTADHGGFGNNHVDNTAPLDYTIPFYVWGVGVAKGADLYKLNPRTRREPGTTRIDYSATVPQPIRNGDAGNLALGLLGLRAIPESLINAKQDLAVGDGG